MRERVPGRGKSQRRALKTRNMAASLGSYRQQETTDPGPVGQCELKIVESSYLHGVGIGIAGVW